MQVPLLVLEMYFGVATTQVATLQELSLVVAMKSRYFILRLRELLVLTNLLLCLKVRVAFMKQFLVQSSTGNFTELPSRRNCHYQ